MMKTKYTDEELVQEIARGNNLAVSYFYNREYENCKRHILKNNGDEADAESVYQEAFIVLFKKLKKPDFQLTGALGGLLYMIVRNQWLNELRKRRKLPLEELHDGRQDVDTEAENKFFHEFYPYVEQGLEQLDDTCRELVSKRYGLGVDRQKMSMEKVAEDMGYASSGSVRQAKHRCLRKLKSIVRELLNSAG